MTLPLGAACAAQSAPVKWACVAVARRETDGSTRRLRRLTQDRLERGPHDVRHDALALGSGVDAICLIEAGHAADPFEQERHEGKVVLLREFRKDLLEARAVRRVGGARQLPP